MRSADPHPLVHLELHTGDMTRARAFLAELCGWRADLVETGSRSYLALGMGEGIGGGIVECSTPGALWLPYVEVDEIRSATDRARELGAKVLLEPREGPAGWRSVVSEPAGAELALWQPKR